MISKFKSRMLSIFLTAVMLMSVFAVGQISADAAEQPISVTVGDVLYKYRDSKAIFELINTYRNQNNLASVEMDYTMLDTAMLRAVELSVYASVTRPNGSKYVDDYSQLIAYDAMSNGSVVKEWKNNDTSNTVMLSSSCKSVGIGVVEVAGCKHVCVLLSNKASSNVIDPQLLLFSKTDNQTIQALPSVLSDVETAFATGTTVLCGSSINAYLYVTNKLYPSAGALLTADNMNVTISNTDSFTYTYGQINAIYPGESKVTITSKQSSAVSASATVKAVSLSLESCSFAAIPDQYYTGKAITPTVSGKDSSGQTLVLDTDYTVEYANNIQPGTATVTIKGKGKYAGYTKTLSFNIVVNQDNAFSITAKVSPASIILGDSATISVSQSGGIAPITYTYAYAVSGSSSWTTLSSSTKNSYTFKPTAANSYNVKVTAVDSAGRTASQTAYLKAEAKMVCSASISKTTAAIGDKITVNAIQQGGVSPTFAFSIKTPSADWKTLKDFSTVSSYTYMPIEPGEHTVLIKFKSTNGQTGEVYKTFTVTGTALTGKSSVSATSASLGKSVTLKGAATGGSGSYQYAYYYKLSTNSSWTTLEGFGSKTSVAFTPKAAGTYNVCIKVKDTTENVVKKYFTVTFKEAFSNTSTLSATKITLGSKITVNASSNASGTCTYGVWYHTKGTDGWSTVQNYGSNAKVNITPTKSGTFEVCVRVKNSAGEIAVKYITFTVNPKLTNNSTLSATTITKGKSITVKCSATGGTSPYTYAVYYKQTSQTSWTEKQKYSSNASVSITPALATTYDVCVKAKDSSNTEVKKYFTVTVKNALANTSTLSATSITLGNSITAKCSATGGTSPYQYQVVYKQTAQTTWSTIQAYGTNTSVSFKPLKATTYDVCIKVKDGSKAEVKKYFTVTVKNSLTNTSTLSATSITLGNSITAKCSATGGTSPYQYQVVYKQTAQTTWSTVQAYGTNTSVSFKPAKATTYDVCIKVKDGNKTEVKKYFTVTVKSAVSNTSTVSATSITKGKSVTVKCAATGGTSPYTYAVYYKQTAQTSWTEKQNFSSNASVSITPATATTYDICVKAKDQSGSVAKKYFTLTVTK